MKSTKDSYILNEYDCIKNIKISIKKNKKVNGIFLDMLINKPILWALVKRKRIKNINGLLRKFIVKI